MKRSRRHGAGRVSFAARAGKLNRGTTRRGGNPNVILLADEAAEGHLAFEVVGLLSLPALVLLNGLFVAAEFALVAVRRTRVEELIAQGVARARAVENALNKLDRSIAATQF